MQKCILVIDDKKEYLDFLTTNLANEGYKVITAGTGAAALEYANRLPDLIILDIALTDMDGLDIIRQLKRNSPTSAIPIIVLTSKGTETDEIVSLEVGSDDFILKPVRINRLLAHMRALLRQSEQIRPNLIDGEVVSFGGLEIRIPDHTIAYGDATLVLPRKEFEILIHLFRHQDRVVTREAISRAVWGSSVQLPSRTIDVHIGRIRKKLGRYANTGMPVAPHLSMDRAIILSQGSSVTITAYTDHQALLSVDGQSPEIMLDGDVVKVEPGDNTVNVVRFQDHGYFYRNITGYMERNPSIGGV